MSDGYRGYCARPGLVIHFLLSLRFLFSLFLSFFFCLLFRFLYFASWHRITHRGLFGRGGGDGVMFFPLSDPFNPDDSVCVCVQNRSDDVEP